MEKDITRATKEDLAKQIARNMALKNDDTDFIDDTEVVEMGSIATALQMKGAQTAVKSAKTATKTAPRKTGVKKPGNNSGSKSVKGKSKASTNSKGNRGKKKKKKGYKKAVILISSLTIFIFAAFVGVYFYGMSSFKGKFLANTSINGISVSGKTEKQAYELVLADAVIPERILLTKADGTGISIPLEDIGYEDNIKVTVSQYFSQQNNYSWFSHYFKKTEYKFNSTFTYDNEQLKKTVKRKILAAPGSVDPVDAYIKADGDEFIIVKEISGDKIDETKIDSVLEYVDECLDKGEYTIDLSVVNCYLNPKVTSEDLTEEVDKLNMLHSIEITLDFNYETVTLYGDDALDWITFDEDNLKDGITVDEDKAMKYVEELAKKYDTYDTDREFNSTSRGKITVPAGDGCYGWWIDQEATRDLLVELIEEGESVTTEPIYYVNPYSQYTYTCNVEDRTAESDIGDTYCEVDLAKQHFWYYKDGKLDYECDVVTGLPTEERNTPGGVYKIWIKEKNVTLKGSLPSGQSWETPVTYWNNISTFGVGLHDATWHSYFGGERYKTNGSHGCINMPYAAAEYVYNNIPMNTPVVMYW